MPVRSPADVRNVLLSGTGGSGKTSITERLLFATGVTKRIGTVEEGNTVSDWTEEEKHHKHSIYPTVVYFEFEGHEVHLIDSPGRADFLGQTIACLPAVETVVVVIDALRGMETNARRLLNAAAERGLPRMIVINKIDDVNADVEAVTAAIREEFGNYCLPINLPTPDRKGVINVFEHDGNDSVGDKTLFSSVHEAHKSIVEQVIEVDDDLTEHYLEKGEGFDPVKLHAAFEKALEQSHLVPILYCSAKTGAGIDDMLHVFASLCPSPVEAHVVEFVRKDNERSEEKDYYPDPNAGGRLVAHIFKVMTDPFVGKLGVFRVHQGTLRAKTDVLIDDQKKPIRIGHLFKLQGKEHVEVQEVGPGEIAAIAKVDEVRFNGVLHDSHDLDYVRVKPLPLPRPMYGLAVELKNHADEAKFANAYHKLMSEDPSFVVDRIAATHQTVMRGLGELHLRIILEKLKSQYHIELVTSPPKVAYKETITGRADGHHRHKKQTGGSGQFGEVYLRIEPLPTDHAEGFEFVSEVVGGTVPRQYWPAVEKGIRQVLADGAIAGYPMTGVKVALTDGKYHDVDSKEIAFISAGKKAFLEAVAKAKPRLLEPFVHIEINAPSAKMGDIAGHLSTKRGRVQDTLLVGSDTCVVKAIAPLAELQTFATELKALTAGAATYTMDYSHDEYAPSNVQQTLMNAFKPKHDEE